MRYFFWHGLIFENLLGFGDEKDEQKKIWMIWEGVLVGAASKAADEIGMRKLGEVFKLFSNDADFGGYMRILNFICLIRAKPKDWGSATTDAIAETDRKAFYLQSMLFGAFRQFNEEVNTGGEREELKKVITKIRLKRDLKKDRPGPKDMARALEQLEQSHYFEQPSKEDEAKLD
jgi:hypothetical protein